MRQSLWAFVFSSLFIGLSGAISLNRSYVPLLKARMRVATAVESSQAATLLNAVGGRLPVSRQNEVK